MVGAQGTHDKEQLAFPHEGRTHDEIAAHVADMRRHPERYSRGRQEFLDAMAGEPALVVPEGSSLRTLERSEAHCQRYPLEDYVWVKVRVVSDPNRGHEGWICQFSLIGVSPAWP